MTVTSIPVSAGVRRVSAVCAAVCGTLAVALPTAVLGGWLFMSPAALVEHFRAPSALSGQLEQWQRLLATVANLPSSVLFAFGLWRAGVCLREFSRGEFFAPRITAGLRDFACATFWAVLLGFIEETATSVIVTWTNGPGLRQLAFGLHSQQVFLALYAVIFWVLAAAMARGASLAHENEQFV
jgi:hypothetical protein